MKSPYAKRSSAEEQGQRVVVLMTPAEIKAVDAWGVPSGMDSRSAALRVLVAEGLRAVAGKQTEATHVG